MQVCIAYIVKEVASFRGLGQLMGMARNRTHIQAPGREKKAACSLRRNWN